MRKLPSASWIRIINNVGASAGPGGGLYCIALSLANDSEREGESESRERSERIPEQSENSHWEDLQPILASVRFMGHGATHSEVSGTTRMWEGQTDCLFCCLSACGWFSLSLFLSPWSKGRRAVQERDKSPGLISRVQFVSISLSVKSLFQHGAQQPQENSVFRSTLPEPVGSPGGRACK